jgi:SAM-dependent methyltransferase
VRLLDRLLHVPGLRRTARGLADWLDLAWSYIVADLSAVAPRAGGRLLDVGCGTKPYEHLFRPYVREYVGIEHEATFAATSASSSGRGPDLTYDGETLPFPDASFDTVLSVQVLEHTPEPRALMAEMCRVLSPGGTLVVCVPFSFRLHEEPHDYWRYSPYGLAALVEPCGVDVVEIVPHGGLWSVLGHKFNSYLAFRVAHLDALGQRLGKLGHEDERENRLRAWTLPVVLPLMVAVSGGARALDRLLPERTETLSYRLLATKRAGG